MLIHMFRFLQILLLLITLCPSVAMAQSAAQYCKGNKNTANLVGCLNKYYEQVKIRLGNNYDIMLKTIPQEKTPLFRNAQQSWITYRDDQCALESSIEAAESLKRIQELHCLIRVSEQRETILDLALGDVEAQNVAQGITPRWENVLHAANEAIYWRSSKYIKADMNCDGRAENIVTGLITAADQDKSILSTQYVIGLVESSPTGRPTAHIFEISGSVDDAAQNCSSMIELRIKEPTLGAAESNQTCMPIGVEVIRQGCMSYDLVWSDNRFSLQPQIIATPNLEAAGN